jgi:hypothetical protein
MFNPFPRRTQLHLRQRAHFIKWFFRSLIGGKTFLWKLIVFSNHNLPEFGLLDYILIFPAVIKLSQCLFFKTADATDLPLPIYIFFLVMVSIPTVILSLLEPIYKIFIFYPLALIITVLAFPFILNYHNSLQDLLNLPLVFEADLGLRLGNDGKPEVNSGTLSCAIYNTPAHQLRSLSALTNYVLEIKPLYVSNDKIILGLFDSSFPYRNYGFIVPNINTKQAIQLIKNYNLFDFNNSEIDERKLESLFLDPDPFKNRKATLVFSITQALKQAAQADPTKSLNPPNPGLFDLGGAQDLIGVITNFTNGSPPDATLIRQNNEFYASLNRSDRHPFIVPPSTDLEPKTASV